MRHVRILGLALIAVFAFTALAAASASAAEPEFKLCVKAAKNAEKKYTGGYNNKTCTEVNAAKEGKYAAEEVTAPVEFTGKSKTSTLYYYVPGGAILYTVTCKKDKDAGSVANSTEMGGFTITFESCEATNVASKVKTKCATAPVLSAAAALLAPTLPAEHPGFAGEFTGSAYECGTTKFTGSFIVVESEVAATSKGETAAFKVNKATGESIPREFLFTGEPYADESSGEVVDGSGGHAVEIGIESTEAIGPKKGLVIIP